MNYIYLLVLSLSLSICQGQTPVLVKDLNPGSNGTTFYDHPSIQIGEVIYFVGDINGSRDLYSIMDGNIQLLAKICPGSCLTFEVFFFEYNGKLYFKKQIDSKINQFWETDGTESGTKLVFEYIGTFKAIAKGNNSKMYIGTYNRTTFKDEVYISDGTTDGTKKISTDVNLGAKEEKFGAAIKYSNGIAFVNITNDSLKIFKYDDENLSLLAKIKVKTGLSVLGLKTMHKDDLVILVHGDNASVSEIYRYDKISKLINKEVTLPFTSLEYPFLKDYNQDSIILYQYNGGHFILSGIPLIKTNITPFSKDYYSNISEKFYKYNERVAYLAVENCGDICWNFKVILFDGKVEQKKVVDVDRANNYDLIGHQNFAFYSSNGPTGRDGKIYIFNLEEKTNKLLYSFTQTFSSQGVKPLGVIDGKLYFLANLNQSFGKELYYIETGISTSTEDITPVSQKEFTVHQSGSQFSITCATDDIRNLHLSFFDRAGRLLKVHEIFTDTEYRFDDTLKGLIFLQITDKKSTVTQGHKLFIP
ncbi:MAG: hypothetical protein IPM42_07200 [Saprospiraceae bacterium]|nr:hypothetical protein [Saprospiraceae bacterium]